nr:helix-turn-helix transcriptional regulator [uncultured Blautia sp.]
MTLGEKLKEARKQAGLSQEQLAEKLGISRSAVAKWETDKGIPDVDNLKALSGLLSVSIDYLLDDGQDMDKTVIKEAIDLSVYEGNRKAKKDSCVRGKYPDARISSLIAKAKLTKGQRILDTVLELFTDGCGVGDIYSSLKDLDKQYYLVEQGDKQLLVLVTDEFIISRELAHKQYSNKFEIGDIRFTKCAGQIK